MNRLNDLLNHAPVLVKAYGKRPGYVYFMIPTVMVRVALLGSCVVADRSVASF